MRIVPDSTITLYEGVSITAGRQLVFSSANLQNVYFTQHELISEANCQMVKKSGWVRINADPELVMRCNYMSWKNPSFDNKRVFALITDYDYVNNECVSVTYAIDYFQTWMFDFTMLNSFIEREHLSIADKEREDTNPYNPALLDLRTPENLPVGPDVEKPYYQIATTPHASAHLCGKEVSNYFNVDDGIGTLIVLSDINFKYMDSQTTEAELPSKFFRQLIYAITTQSDNECSWYHLSSSMYNTLHDPSAIINPPQDFRGSAWGSDWIPGANNQIKAPVSYLYIANQGGDSYTSGTEHITGSLVDGIVDQLTTYDCLDSILGIYAIPHGLMMTSAIRNVLGLQALCVNMETAFAELSSVVRNKKLCMYPYSYIRLQTPVGDCKELRIEGFEDVQTDQTPTVCKLLLWLDVYCTPTMVVSPVRYKMGGMNPSAPGMDSNPNESIVMNQFPNMPYQTDSFKSMLASVSHNLIQNNTQSYSYEIEQMQLDQTKEQLGVIDTFTEGMGKAKDSYMGGDYLGAIGNAAGAVKDATLAAAQATLNLDKRRNIESMSQDAYKTLSGHTPNTVYRNYRFTQPAFAANEYHLNNGEGSINYNVFSYMDIIALRVGLNPAIRERYDKYFDNYGYATGRFGIPRVYNFLHNVNDDELLPSWHDIEEDYGEFSHVYVSYVKTSGCKVTGVMLPVAQAIQNIFDTGCQFVNVGYTPPVPDDNNGGVY